MDQEYGAHKAVDQWLSKLSNSFNARAGVTNDYDRFAALDLSESMQKVHATPAVR